MPTSGEKSEAEKAMEAALKRKEEKEAEKLKQWQEQRRKEKEEDEKKIEELRLKAERRKKEREEEEKKKAEQQELEKQKWQQVEEEKKKKKEEERKKKEQKKKEQEEKSKGANTGKKNFKITKNLGTMSNVIQAKEDMGKSKEQLEHEKKAILDQRCGTCQTTGMKEEQLEEMAKGLFERISKLLGENYDMEEKFKRQQYDMMELAERARQMNKGNEESKQRTASGIKVNEDYDPDTDRFKFAPPPVQLASKYERKLDRRSFAEKLGAFQKKNKAEAVAEKQEE